MSKQLKKRWSFTITSDAETLAEAKMRLKVDKQIDSFNHDFEVKELGFVHPDGRILPCDASPEGFRLWIEMKKKDGEYEVRYFALPNDDDSNANTVAVSRHPRQWINGEWRPVPE